MPTFTRFNPARICPACLKLDNPGMQLWCKCSKNYAVLVQMLFETCQCLRLQCSCMPLLLLDRSVRGNKVANRIKMWNWILGLLGKLPGNICHDHLSRLVRDTTLRCSKCDDTRIVLGPFIWESMNVIKVLWHAKSVKCVIGTSFHLWTYETPKWTRIGNF